MIFNSFQFILLFPLIFAVYYIVDWSVVRKSKDSRIANILLIAISYGLYIQWNPQYALVLLGVTAVTYFSALLIDKQKAYGRKKYLICTGALLTLLPLIVFKYTDFVLSCISDILKTGSTIEVNLIAPIGISFFTFQALGYLFDVYFKRTTVEKDWWDYMLFVSFLPQILSGPISRASELLPQIKAKRVKKMVQRFFFTISPWYKATDDSEYSPLMELCQQYAIPVFYYFIDDSFITSKHLFKDSSHLNEDGAILLCNKVCDELSSNIN